VFPRAGLRSLGKQFGGWPVFVIVVGIIAVTAPSTGHWEVSAGVGVILLLFGIATLRHTVVTVTDDRLTIVNRWPFARRRRQWPQSALRAIGVWQGLRVVTDASNDCFFANWDRTQLAWAGAVLCQVLRTPADLPPGAGEIRVSYRGGFWDKPQNGLLCARPGCLQIRHSLARQPHLVFRAHKGLTAFVKQAGSLYLLPTDMTCRVDDIEGTYLDIYPQDVFCEMSEGRPWLRVGSLGRFLFDRVNLPIGVMDTRAFAARGSPFRLTVWCNDPETLPRALEQFWSGKEG